MKTITKGNLVKIIAKTINCNQSLAHEMIGSLFQEMRETLMKGNRIEIRGFGTFIVKDTKPKPKARNPRTNEWVHVPARRKTHFKPGKQLKEGLHRKKA